MVPIDVTFEALGHTWRVHGAFTPSRPVITSGPADNWEPADPAEWDEFQIELVGDGDSPEMSNLLERLRVPGYVGSALDHILDLAELQWLRDRDAERWAA
ncbi:MAG: hypothetical protein LT106_18795 [Burkholderiaceae bacterium]|nr:hypothetical protein [Burkholderiaceae bacterium]